ncbi:uncharacterized protein LOC133425396 [Cololabis saira]|uniref:uncharacterized protein LOC133425396 n=1 Tax=Cololabis saira TaxID=129043 RepID=UPI002AD3C84F|nr:uncharacterized protein LOC133425396 [Cololabis saira]
MELRKILLLVLVLVLVSAEDENQKEVQGDLGGNVDLTCSINIPDIYWYMEIHNQLRGNIGRTFSSYPDYSSPDFKTKYLIKGNRLVIKNLTAEDFRRYFCGKMRSGNITFLDTFHLIPVLVVSSTPHEDLNHHTGTTDEPGTGDTRICQNEPIVFSSFCLNFTMTLVFVGLTCRYFKRKRSSCRMKDPSRLMNPQDEDVDLFPSGIMSECFYHKVQLPGRFSAD